MAPGGQRAAAKPAGPDQQPKVFSTLPAPRATGDPSQFTVRWIPHETSTRFLSVKDGYELTAIDVRNTELAARVALLMQELNASYAETRYWQDQCRLIHAQNQMRLQDMQNRFAQVTESYMRIIQKSKTKDEKEAAYVLEGMQRGAFTDAGAEDSGYRSR